MVFLNSTVWPTVVEKITVLLVEKTLPFTKHQKSPKRRYGLRQGESCSFVNGEKIDMNKHENQS